MQRLWIEALRFAETAPFDSTQDPLAVWCKDNGLMLESGHIAHEIIEDSDPPLVRSRLLALRRIDKANHKAWLRRCKQGVANERHRTLRFSTARWDWQYNDWDMELPSVIGNEQPPREVRRKRYVLLHRRQPEPG